jgi:hypothetical protein
MDTHQDRNVLKDPWRKFTLRAQNLKRNNDSPAIIQMTVLVNSDGNPILWLEPKVILLEPRLDFDFDSLQSELTSDQLIALLKLVVRDG